MTATGKFNRRIVFQRATVVTDSHGGEAPTWGQLGAAWASVSFGTGQERREAAQEAASQAATFVVRWTAARSTIGPRDRILALSGEWDITSVAPVGRNHELHFTATSRVS